MRSPPLLFVLSLALLGPGQARAQTAPALPSSPAPGAPAAPSAPLTLAPLTQLRSGPGWRGADLRYRSAELALASARARAGLSVTAAVEASAVKAPLATGEAALSATVTLQAAASVLPWSPALEGVRNAERALARAALDLRAARASLSVSAVQAYWGARHAAVGRDLAEGQRALAERQLAAAQAQRAAGVLPPAGLLVREQALAQAQTAQRQAQANVDLTARQLVNLLGQAVTLPAGAAAYGPLPAAPRDPGPAGALVARALVGRPEVRGAQNDLADAQAQLRAAQLDARLPDLTASVQYGQLAGGPGPAGWTAGGSLDVKSGVLAGQLSVPLRNTSGQLTNQPANQPTGVALALKGSFPLIGGGKRPALASAEVGVQAAQLALDSARQSVDLEVRQRQAELLTALDTLTLQRGAQRQAAEAQATARIRLDAGLITSLDLEEADLNAQQAQLTAEDALTATDLASLRLAQATTELDPSLLTLPATMPAAPTPEARP